MSEKKPFYIIGVPVNQYLYDRYRKTLEKQGVKTIGRYANIITINEKIFKKAIEDYIASNKAKVKKDEKQKDQM